VVGIRLDRRILSHHGTRHGHGHDPCRGRSCVSASL
jgi:hypothetical protein